MRAKVIHDGLERTFALILETGDEVVASIEAFATDHALSGCRITATGAVEAVTLGYFDWERKDYDRVQLDEQMELLSIVGDIAMQGSRPKLHAHVVLGRRDASTCGGHLLRASVRPTLEVLLTEAPRYLRREFDPASGLARIRFGP